MNKFKCLVLALTVVSCTTTPTTHKLMKECCKSDITKVDRTVDTDLYLDMAEKLVKYHRDNCIPMTKEDKDRLERFIKLDSLSKRFRVENSINK